MNEPAFSIQDLFDSTNGRRIPKIVTTRNAILAFAKSGGLLRRSEDSGEHFEEELPLESAGGNAVFDEQTGDVLVVRPKYGDLYRSRDDGKSWSREEIEVRPNSWGHGGPGGVPSEGTCSESGITIRDDEHRGRLVVPVRVQPPFGNNDQEYWSHNYNTSIYSDDHGASWQVGEPVQSGTGEGTLAELADGRIYYNSRCHMAVDARRRIAFSHDGGHRWVDWQVCDTLRETGEPFYYRYGSRPAYGCNAGLVRLPPETTGGKDVHLFCTPDNPGGTRFRMTVWASFDSASTWTVRKLVYPGPSAYSSIAADREGWIYLLFERGLSANPGHDIDHHRISLARFNLAWVLQP